MAGFTKWWLRSAALRRRLHSDDQVRHPRIRDDAIKAYAPGRSFIDVGGMWSINGRDSFVAEDSGATAITLLDEYRTDEFDEQVRQRGSNVRFVRGDLHDPAVRAEAGQHDVVYCSGVLYHVPHPVQTLESLRELGREYLILLTHTIPEVPFVKQASVFWPALDDRTRLAYAAAYERMAGAADRVGLSTPFDPAAGYANWWWGMSRSAVEAMLRSAVGDVIDSTGHDLLRRFVVRIGNPEKH
jgi:hypothetical protein